jgi:hypothetical protein
MGQDEFATAGGAAGIGGEDGETHGGPGAIGRIPRLAKPKRRLAAAGGPDWRIKIRIIFR